MKWKIAAALTLLLLIGLAVGRPTKLVAKKTVTKKTETNGTAINHTVILTLGTCNAEDAVKNTKVKGCDFHKSETHSGYVKVDEDYDINLFFWFCFANATARSKVPVLLWLDGGPGISSMVGALMGNGPFRLHPNKSVVLNEHSWTHEFNMLYVDSPVGVGYSFSSQNTIHTELSDVIGNLYTLLWYLNRCAFGEYFKNGLYIGGSSFAGIYIPLLGKMIHDENHNHGMVEDDYIPLHGIYLESPMLDLKTVLMAVPESLHRAGVYTAHEELDHKREITDFFHDVKYHDAHPEDEPDVRLMHKYTEMLFNISAGELNHRGSTLGRSGPSTRPSFEVISEYLNMQGPHKGFHAADNFVLLNMDVASNLQRCIFLVSSSTVELGYLMDIYKVLLYSGSADEMVTGGVMDRMMQSLKWGGKSYYDNEIFEEWNSEEFGLEGWFISIDYFTRVTVKNAGSHVSFDQGRVTRAMIKHFVEDDDTDLNHVLYYKK